MKPGLDRITGIIGASRLATDRKGHIVRKLILLLFCVSSLLAPRVVSANAVYNGGFELGDFTGWILSGNPLPGVVDTSLPHSGTYAAALYAANSLGYLEQFLSTTPGTVYNLTYFLASDGGTPNEFSAAIDGKTLFDQSDIPSRSYARYSFDFTATGVATDLKLGFRDDPGELHLDDVSVNPAAAVPEPSSGSLGLLVLGIGLMGRLFRSQVGAK